MGAGLTSYGRYVDTYITLGYFPNGYKRGVYYKVKAINEYGESEYSNTVYYLVYMPLSR